MLEIQNLYFPIHNFVEAQVGWRQTDCLQSGLLSTKYWDHLKAPEDII